MKSKWKYTFEILDSQLKQTQNNSLTAKERKHPHDWTSTFKETFSFFKFLCKFFFNLHTFPPCPWFLICHSASTRFSCAVVNVGVHSQSNYVCLQFSVWSHLIITKHLRLWQEIVLQFRVYSQRRRSKTESRKASDKSVHLWESNPLPSMHCSYCDCFTTYVLYESS